MKQSFDQDEYQLLSPPFEKQIVIHGKEEKIRNSKAKEKLNNIHYECHHE